MDVRRSDSSEWLSNVVGSIMSWMVYMLIFLWTRKEGRLSRTCPLAAHDGELGQRIRMFQGNILLMNCGKASLGTVAGWAMAEALCHYIAYPQTEGGFVEGLLPDPICFSQVIQIEIISKGTKGTVTDKILGYDCM